VSGHSLPEVIIAVSLVGMMLVSLYTGFSSGFTVLRSARENLRAAEILNRHAEHFRLYTWSQLLDSENFVPATFIETSDLGESLTASAGVVYAGTVEVSTPMDLPAAYRDRMRLVTISLTWTNLNGNTPVVNQRQIQTCVSRYGMQSYVAAP
jgi:hypothetical protein